MKYALVILAVLVFFVCGHAASVTTSLTPASAAVGDVLEYTIQISGANVSKVQLPVAGGGDFVLLNVDSSRAAEGIVTFSYAVYDTGGYELPAMPVVISGAETLMTQPHRVTIQSVVPDTASAIHENKPYMEHPFRLKDVIKEYLPWIIAVGVILLSALGLWWWLRRKKRALEGGAVVEILLPPHEEAIRALLALKAKQLPQRGLMKEFFLEYTEILRRYIERRYAIPALEMTTYDLEREFEQSWFPPLLKDSLLPALREGDLVKFAKFIPRLETCDVFLELGFRVIDETKEREEPVMEEAKAA